MIYDLTSKDGIKLCLFFISSTGNGDFPDNGDYFHKFLRHSTSDVDEYVRPRVLSHVFYTILGLGDSNYSQF